jgi:hydrogenase maturation protein HypF
VTVEAFGTSTQLQRLSETLARPVLAAARVTDITAEEIPWRKGACFDIVESRKGGAARLSIPPDLALCEDCRREMKDPGDRRFGYAFINCTQCGPRYTLCESVPYDRSRTTMRRFLLCVACEREYRDPEDRRFHAEPDACAQCGPRLLLLAPDGTAIEGDPIQVACDRLRAGEVVAIKSLGGVHLACDACSDAAVRLLRKRKHREEKPLAVMAPGLEFAERLADIDPVERDLLCSAARPIVLLRRRDGIGVAHRVAARHPRLGVMLPYTPLHELLLAAFGGPLVMTSGNLSDEPMATENNEVLERLGMIADAFLLHDRPIANRCDDSVASVIAGQPTLLRRARGYVPSPIEVPGRFERPILACGAHLKNTFCLAYRGEAWMGPHIGDLETEESCRAFETTLERFIGLVGIKPEIIACDLHPDYYSTRYALAQSGMPRIGVQHHHAHIGAVCAENGVSGPVIGLAWDGTGYGDGGAAWGGEALYVDGAQVERVATLRPLPLAGGDHAVREVWRVALAALDDAFDGDPPLRQLRLFGRVDPEHVTIVRRLIATGLRAPLAHGVGRYFDAVGALVLARTRAGYEGQVAAECGFLGSDTRLPPYAFEVRPGAVSEFDLRAMFRALVGDLIDGVPSTLIVGRFHATLALVGKGMVDVSRARFGGCPVAMSGGCFQNEPLVEAILRRLGAEQRVFRHRLVPPGDGGIALGQAWVADVRARAGGR